jgi:hypothetical protein
MNRRFDDRHPYGSAIPLDSSRFAHNAPHVARRVRNVHACSPARSPPPVAARMIRAALRLPPGLRTPPTKADDGRQGGDRPPSKDVEPLVQLTSVGLQSGSTLAPALPCWDDAGAGNRCHEARTRSGLSLRGLRPVLASLSVGHERTRRSMRGRATAPAQNEQRVRRRWCGCFLGKAAITSPPATGRPTTASGRGCRVYGCRPRRLIVLC